MFKRLLSLWLIVSVLGVGAAWAFDGHSFDKEHDTASAWPVQDSPDHDDSADCDHCCHLAFHLLGVFGDRAAQGYTGSADFYASSDVSLTSKPRAPPLKPPRP